MQWRGKYTSVTIEELLGNCDFTWLVPRCYKQGSLKQEKLRESLEEGIEGNWEEMGRKELDCAKKTSYVLQLQWDWYNSCVEIRCQDMTSEHWGP
jgi:hypothetical protein